METGLRTTADSTMRASGIITLTTDFGTSDTYVAEMKGVILGINAGARIVDITHQVPPQDISEGAYAIGRSHLAFPAGTVHVVVVDPGVGSSRDAIVVTTPSGIFVAPDNGVLTNILNRKAGGDGGAVTPLPEGYRAYRLTNSGYWRHPVSSTFHGRDVFAPVAAHLTIGAPPSDMGEEAGSVVALSHNQVRREGTSLTGRVQHVDRFGNLVTNIPAGLLSPTETPWWSTYWNA